MPRRTHRGWHDSLKVPGGKIYHASGLELAIYRILDRLPWVTVYQRWTVPILYFWGRGKKQKKYYPDILINEKLVVEVKPYAHVGHRKCHVKWCAAQKYCDENKLEFCVYTSDIVLETPIRRRPRRTREDWEGTRKWQPPEKFKGRLVLCVEDMRPILEDAA